MAGSIIGPAVGFGLNALLGPKDRQIQALNSPVAAKFSGGGLVRLPFAPGSSKLRVSSTKDRQQLVQNLSDVFSQQAGRVGGLLGLVRPGFGRLTEARLAAIRDRSTRAIGNLRQNLARRRILGSSFASDALARTEREFAREEADARARSFLEELDVTSQLFGQEAQAASASYQTLLNEENLKADLAAGASGQFAAAANANAQLLAGLNAQSIAGFGRFAAQTGNTIGEQLGPAISRGFNAINPFTANGVTFTTPRIGNFQFGF